MPYANIHGLLTSSKVPGSKWIWGRLFLEPTKRPLVHDGLVPLSPLLFISGIDDAHCARIRAAVDESTNVLEINIREIEAK